MENAISGLIIIGVLVLALLGLTESSLSTQAALAETTRLMQTRTLDQARTDITPLSATTSILGDTVDITLKNTGHTKLADFAHWDVILQYTDTFGAEHSEWYPYATKWMKQIYLTAPSSLEVIEPNIFNPGEEMVIEVPVAFTIGSGTTNVAAISTPNGVTATAIFNH